MLDIIKSLIKLNYEHRFKFAHMSNMFDPMSFNREFKTIKLDYGRQTGKTYSIGSYARKDDLIIVRNEETKRSFIRFYPSCMATIITDSQQDYECSMFMRNRREYDIVWIDEPFSIKHKFYYSLNANVFIELGQ